jgi:sialic acid synthase SpsE
MTHCTSIYPCPSDKVNLRIIPYLIEKFNVPIGLSDHTDNIFSSFGAIAHGACIIEKHFTLNRSLIGPDHKSSIEPDELKQLVEGCNTIYQSNGSLKKIFEEEKQILAWARESVVTEKDLLKGDELNINNIWVKRPAPINGVIAPRDYKKIMGRKVNKNIKKDTQLKWEDLC